MIKIYNTFSRRKEEFVPIKNKYVGMYVCGPTVYSLSHLGHAKSYVSFDIVYRYFLFKGYKVKYVQNITDVGHLVGDGDEGEDKIARQAELEQLDAYEIAYKYEVEHFKCMDKLNVLRPSISCRASGFIIEMIEAIKEIISKGYAYVSDLGNVYFDVKKYEKYGQLSNRKIEDSVSGERIKVASDKRSPEDFALWKSAEANALMQWTSPWGRGCPGWHMECSVLSKKFLGNEFDIHGGGIDNIFPHHECECAQADVISGKVPMKYFMHNGLVTVDGQKMGKSLGNFTTLVNLFEKYNPMTVRYFLLQFHYRSSTHFSDEALQLAEKQYGKIKENINAISAVSSSVATKITDSELKNIYDNFIAAMDEDFNTALALVELNNLNKIITRELQDKTTTLIPQINLLVKWLAEDVLGLNFDNGQLCEESIPQEVKDLAELRWQAKKEKKWAEADGFREQVNALGYVINDNNEGYIIEKI